MPYQAVGVLAREQAAVHEAAHVVVALFLSKRIGDTSITRHHDGSFIGEANVLHRYGRGASVEELCENVAVLLAGTVAERIAGHESPVTLAPKAIIAEIRKGAAEHWQHDISQAIDVISASGRSTAMGRLLVTGWMKADEILRRHWEAVMAVANEIVQYDSIGATRAVEIAREHGMTALPPC